MSITKYFFTIYTLTQWNLTSSLFLSKNKRLNNLFYKYYFIKLILSEKFILTYKKYILGGDVLPVGRKIESRTFFFSLSLYQLGVLKHNRNLKAHSLPELSK